MNVPLRDTGQTQYSKYAEKVMTLAYNKGVEVYVFARELRRLCKITGYNFPGMFVQAWHETAGFSSDAWRYRINPAGIKNKSGDTYQRYYNGVDAARAMVVHMSAYARPDKGESSLVPYRHLDVRYLIALNANLGKTFNTYNDLAGHWAEDPTYGTQIYAKYLELLGSV